MKKSPVAAMSNIRDAVRRKSVGLNFSIFARSVSSAGDDERSEHGTGEEGDDSHDELDSSHYDRSRQNSTPNDDEADGCVSPALSSRSSYVEPPEPPLPPPGGLLEAATRNVQGKMQTLMETLHEVTTSHVRHVNVCSCEPMSSPTWQQKVVFALCTGYRVVDSCWLFVVGAVVVVVVVVDGDGWDGM